MEDIENSCIIQVWMVRYLKGQKQGTITTSALKHSDKWVPGVSHWLNQLYVIIRQ